MNIYLVEENRQQNKNIEEPTGTENVKYFPDGPEEIFICNKILDRVSINIQEGGNNEN